MNAITKERIKLFIKNPLDNGLTRGEQMELARIALASLEAEAVMFCISGQNVDSEEHVSTSKAVVDAWVEEWNQVDGSPGRTTVQNYATLLSRCLASAGSAG